MYHFNVRFNGQVIFNSSKNSEFVGYDSELEAQQEAEKAIAISNFDPSRCEIIIFESELVVSLLASSS